MPKKSRLLFAIAAFIFFSFLFCLPGSSIPEDDWLDTIWADKWVHIGIFTILLFLWCRALEIKHLHHYAFMLVLAVAYGYGIEMIQHYFIPNRSFDLKDVIADFIGSVIGILLWDRYKKNKPL